MIRILFLIPLYSLRNIIFYSDIEKINKLKGECVVFNQEMNSLSLKYDLDLETKNKLRSKIQLIEAKVTYYITSICNKVRDISLEQFYVLIDHEIENLFRGLQYNVDYLLDEFQSNTNFYEEANIALGKLLSTIHEEMKKILNNSLK